MNYFQRINTSELYQPFYDKLVILVDNCKARGVEYWCISGFRSWPEQDALFSKGRDAKGNVIDKGLVVTNARGGQSNHNYTVAADFCMDKDVLRAGLQPDWNVKSYEVLAEEAEKLGLEAGLRWKFVDAPHIQLPLSKHGLSFKDLKAAYLKGAVPEVHALLNKYAW